VSLAIDVDTVTAVLLLDGWHKVSAKSFFIDSYEFLWSGQSGVTVEKLEQEHPDKDAMLVHGGGQSGITAAGFSFTDGEGGHLSGPLSAVLAVRH
jgi:hypothetical protein